jgi:mannose-6-phosphate isomerase-like protein (cupin superfamily)
LSGAVTYKYVRPDLAGREKTTELLACTDLAVVAIQVIKGNCAKNNLHMHPSVDGFWTVLSGHARFYSNDDQLVADLGPMEGVVVPRGFVHRIESVGDEELEIMQVEATAKPTGKEWKPGDPLLNKERIDIEPRREGQTSATATKISPPVISR